MQGKTRSRTLCPNNCIVSPPWAYDYCVGLSYYTDSWLGFEHPRLTQTQAMSNRVKTFQSGQKHCTCTTVTATIKMRVLASTRFGLVCIKSTTQYSLLKTTCTFWSDIGLQLEKSNTCILGQNEEKRPGYMARQQQYN